MSYSSGLNPDAFSPKADLRHPLDAGPAMSPQEFSSQLRATSRIMWLIAVGIVGDAAEAEDVVQEAAMVAYRKLDQFKPGTSFRAWAGMIVRNVALNTLRSTRRRRGAVNELTSTTQAALASNHSRDGGDPVSLDGVLDLRVVGALSDLGDIARACLLLRTVGDLHYSEIATLLDIPEGTAMSHVHRARVYLRERLAHVWADHNATSGNEM